MAAGNEELGWVAVSEKDSVLWMDRFQVIGCESFSSLDAESRMCVDALMRAAASYGANQRAYKLATSELELAPYLSSVGFQKKGDAFESDLSKIVKIC